MQGQWTIISFDTLIVNKQKEKQATNQIVGCSAKLQWVILGNLSYFSPFRKMQELIDSDLTEMVLV